MQGFSAGCRAVIASVRLAADAVANRDWTSAAT